MKVDSPNKVLVEFEGEERLVHAAKVEFEHAANHVRVLLAEVNQLWVVVQPKLLVEFVYTAL